MVLTCVFLNKQVNPGVDMRIVLKCTLNLNSVNQLIFVMVKCSVVSEVRTEFLNNI
jgi:hypothetical protein